MKKNNLPKTTFLIIALFVMSTLSLYSQVGIGNILPQGALDITSTNDGLIVPRLALVNTTTATVVTPTESEIVYNTATINDVTPGFYYWDSAKWVRVITGTASNDWTTTGNTGTVATTNFVGTTNAIDFVTRTNNTEKTRVTSAGNVGIGTPAPAAKLDVAAGVTTVNSIINATGSINDYLQFNVQNTSTGIQAQSGYSATADNGTATSGFAWMGINNSTFNFPTSYNIGLANDVSYIGSGQDMYIANAHTSKSIIFSTGKTTTPFFNERMRITNAGNVGIGTPTPSTKSSLDVASTTTGVLIPRMTTAQRTAIAPTATDLGLKVYDTTTKTFWFWNGTIWVQDATSTNSWGLTGNAGTAAATNFIGTTDANDLVFRTSNTEKMRVLATTGQVSINNTAPLTGDLLTITTNATNQYGVNGYNTIAGGEAIYGLNNNIANDFSAIEGTTNSAAGSGVYGHSSGTPTALRPNPTGVSGGYDGVTSSGLRIGVRGASGILATTSPSAANSTTGNQLIGVLGSYTGLTGSYYGVGVYGLAKGGVFIAGNVDAAVVGWGANNANYSGYFNGNHVITNGTKSASVGTSKGNQLLYVTETPGVWFEDIGRGKLVNGYVKITLDPIFLETVFIDDKHPISVFLQEEGDSKGLYVVPQKDGFLVKEKQGGTSNIEFSYRIMAKRLHFQDHRFGSDPVWGGGDTRKYNKYATPPPVEYADKVKMDEYNKKNPQKDLYPEGFIIPAENINKQPASKENKNQKTKP